MAIELSLTRMAVRALLPSYVSQGLGMNAIETALRSQFGTLYRHETLWADIREFRDTWTKEGLIRGLSRNIPVPTNFMVQTPLRQAFNYRIFARTTMVDIETGETTRRVISVYDDTAGTIDDMTQKIADSARVSESVPGVEYTEIKIMSVHHNENMPYN